MIPVPTDRGAASLGVGTVQFGLDYGVTNTAGKVPAAQARAILEYAAEHGVRTIDTAALYGDSESVVGQAVAGLDFDVVTKTVKVGHLADAGVAADAVARGFDASLKALRADRVYGLMLHDARDLIGPCGDAIWARLESAKAAGTVKKIGVSIYTGEDIDATLSRYPIDLLQLPLNALDRRPEDGGQLRRLAASGVEVHARSAFLQGILLADPATVPPHLNGLVGPITAMQADFTRAGLTVMEGLIAGVLSHSVVRRVIVGATTLGEFRQIVAAAKRVGASPDLPAFGPWPIKDQRLLNPAMWNALRAELGA